MPEAYMHDLKPAIETRGGRGDGALRHESPIDLVAIERSVNCGNRRGSNRLRRLPFWGRLAQLVRARASHALQLRGRMLEAVGFNQLLACALRFVSGRLAAFSAR